MCEKAALDADFVGQVVIGRRGDSRHPAQRAIRIRRLALSSLAIGLVALLSAEVRARAFGPMFLLNFSESVPKGVYWLRPIAKLQKGMYVALSPSARAVEIAKGRSWFRERKMFLKQVAALEGDRVCNVNGEIEVNGVAAAKIHATDRQGLPLPSFEGCRTLTVKEVFLLGPDSEWSFDSRYFGIVQKRECRAEAYKFFQ